MGSLTPVVAFLIAIPVAFVSTLAAIAAYIVGAVILGILVNKALRYRRSIRAAAWGAYGWLVRCAVPADTVASTTAQGPRCSR